MILLRNDAQILLLKIESNDEISNKSGEHENNSWVCMRDSSGNPFC